MRSTSIIDWCARCGAIALVAMIGCATPESPAPAPPQTNAVAPKPLPAKPADAKTSGAATRKLFDGKTLTGWRISDFAGSGPVRVEEGKLLLEMGTMTGVTYTNDVPTMNYEISLEAMRVDGSDFFCGLTFPVGKDPCSLIVGGWGGGVVGLSSLDGQDASSNETTQYMNFEKGRWYKVRLRVIPGKILAWIDGEKVIDVDVTDRKISVRIEVEESRPLGLASWSTTAALRNIELRKL
jgi:hypothetical protein